MRRSEVECGGRLSVVQPGIDTSQAQRAHRFLKGGLEVYNAEEQAYPGALMGLLHRAGLPTGDVLALGPKDLDIDAGTIRGLHGKGDKVRMIGRDPAAFAIVEKWMSVRKTGAHQVFCTLKGHEVKQPYIRDMLKRMAKRAGITKRVHPHGLRHTFANELANEGERIHVIRRQLGHSNAATTASYLDHIAPGDVGEAIKKRQWAA